MKRPLSITIIGWLAILAGAVCVLFLVFVGLLADSGSSSVSWFHRFRGSGLLIGGTLAALAGGVLLLKGSPWGRWLVLASLVLPPLNFPEVHVAVIVWIGLVVIVCGYSLFRPKANTYFREKS